MVYWCRAESCRVNGSILSPMAHPTAVPHPSSYVLVPGMQGRVYPGWPGGVPYTGIYRARAGIMRPGQVLD